MTCPRCGKETSVCSVCPAGSDCRRPMCAGCAREELREAVHVAAYLDDRMNLLDRGWLFWRRLKCALQARLSGRDREPLWVVHGGSTRDIEVRTLGSHRHHRVSVTVLDDGYELACDSCDFSEHVSDAVDADNFRRFHEEFLATLVARWSFD